MLPEEWAELKQLPEPWEVVFHQVDIDDLPELHSHYCALGNHNVRCTDGMCFDEKAAFHCERCKDQLLKEVRGGSF